MKTLITEVLVRKLAMVDQDIWDTRCRGLVLRGRSSGRHSYRFQVRRGRWITIGATDDFKPDAARLEAEKLRGDIAHGKDPHAERRAEHAASLSLFLEKDYGPWVKANRQTGAETLRRLAATFGEFARAPSQTRQRDGKSPLRRLPLLLRAAAMWAPLLVPCAEAARLGSSLARMIGMAPGFSRGASVLTESRAPKPSAGSRG